MESESYPFVTYAPPATLLIRLMVGGVFLSEGLQKFLFPAVRGAGRFETMGLPSPELLGAFVGSTEVICGALVLAGLFRTDHIDRRYKTVCAINICQLRRRCA